MKCRTRRLTMRCPVILEEATEARLKAIKLGTAVHSLGEQAVVMQPFEQCRGRIQAAGLLQNTDIELGEVVFGGVGSGLYGMLIFAIMAVFIAGLMIGRTPEYIGKKIESFEMKMSSIAILVMPFIVLVGTAVAVSLTSGQAAVANPAAHGFSEILYAFTSASNNNGSAFAGLSANTLFYNTALGLAMWFGRFWPIVAVLAIAGSLAAKKRVPVTSGTMLTYGPTFVILLIGTVLLVGALTFVPALALGPVVEHITLRGG